VSKTTASKRFTSAGWVAALAVMAIALVVTAGFARPGMRHNGSVVAAVTSKTMIPQKVMAAHDRVRTSYAALPLAFEANEGQASAQVKYVARGSGYKLFLTSKQAIMALPAGKRNSEVRDMMMNKRRGASRVKALLKKRTQSGQEESSLAVVRMNLLGANPHSQLVAADRQPGVVNYFLGNDPSKWHSNIGLYGKVNYQTIYPGIDLSFHGASQQ